MKACTDTPAMRLLLPTTLALLGLAWCSTAIAQQPSTRSPAPLAQPAQPNPAALSRDMETSLRKAGFTDLQIMPNSVFVRGKDKTGQPVAMVLNPGSMTEMVTLDPHSGSAAGGNGAPLTGSATFATVLPSEKLASKIVGIDIVDGRGGVLGTIRDVAIDHGGVQAYIVRVSGVLGIGVRYAAVTPAAITLSIDQANGRYKAMMDATPEQMKAAPEFKYRDVDEATK